MAWPANGNNVQQSSNFGVFGKNNVLIVQFIAPPSGSAELQLSNNGPPYAMRKASLSMTPCGPALLYSVAGSQTPVVHLQVGGGGFGVVTVTPGVTYYWSVTNRNPDGSNSCPQASCGMRIDFNKG
jgi:hypothetical protein